MRGKQSARLLALWGMEQGMHIGLLDDPAVGHHRYLIGAAGHDPHVMGDQQHPEMTLCNQSFKQVQKARLSHYVEIAGGFVGQQEAAVGKQREGNHHPLQHAAAELEGK